MTDLAARTRAKRGATGVLADGQGPSPGIAGFDRAVLRRVRLGRSAVHDTFTTDALVSCGATLGRPVALEAPAGWVLAPSRQHHASFGRWQRLADPDDAHSVRPHVVGCRRSDSAAKKH